MSGNGRGGGAPQQQRAGSPQDLRGAVARQQDAQRQNAGGQLQRLTDKTVRDLLQKMAPEIKRALPKHMDPDRLARITLTCIRTMPKLLACDPRSLMAAIMQSAQLGLEPGLLGHCYILPYKNEATFIIGYRGMIDLSRRSGDIETIYAHEVYENDYFKLSYGINPDCQHIPWHLREDQPVGESGPVKGAYMVAKFKGGGYYIHYMPLQEILKHKKRSPAANSEKSPWNHPDDCIEMYKKTVVRSGWKWLPISVEIMRQVEGTDETIKHEIAEEMAEVPEAEYEISDEELAAMDPGSGDQAPQEREQDQDHPGQQRLAVDGQEGTQ